MKVRAQKTIDEHQLLQPGDRVAVGFSGGADSIALLAFLLDIADQYKLDLVACHVNHQLRGDESNRDEAFVRAFCAERGVECRVLTIDAAALAAQQGCSVEVAARGARYRFFEEAAGPNGKIATAHTLSDSIETTVFHLARGTGLRGLCGIPTRRGNIIRPLIDCTRQQVEQYCRENGLAFVTDSTNFTDDYTRNIIRHHIVPRLYEINPAAHRAIGGLHQRLGQDNDYLETTALEALNALLVGEDNLDRAGYLKLHPAIRYRVLRLLFDRAGVEPSARLAGLADTIISAGSGRQELTKGVYLYSNDGQFGVQRQTAAPDAPYFEIEITLPPPGQSCVVQVAGREVRLQNSPFEPGSSQKVHNCHLKNSLDCAKISDVPLFRCKKEGDRFAPAGRGITKTLKKMFQEASITPEQRRRLLILAAGEHILWVEGLGVSSLAAPGPQTQNMITIELLSKPEEQQ